MGHLRNYNKFKKKLYKYGGPEAVSSSKLFILHKGLDYPKILSENFDQKVIDDVRGVSSQFPELGKRFNKMDIGEKRHYLEVVRRIGLNAASNKIKNGVKLSELASDSHYHPETVDLLKKFGTPKNKKFLEDLGVHPKLSGYYSAIFNFANKKDISAVLKKIRQRNPQLVLYPNIVVKLISLYKKYPKTVLSFIGLKKNNTKFGTDNIVHAVRMYDVLRKKKGPKEAAELIKGKWLFLDLKHLVKVRKKRADLKRFGKPLVYFNFSSEFVNSGKAISLAKKGVFLFPCRVTLKKAVSSNQISRNRHLLVLEVPEHKELLSQTVGNKSVDRYEHFKGATAFGDLLIKKGELFIQELQSDIVSRLPESVASKFDSWEKILILSAAKIAKERGIDNIIISSPNILAKLWPHLSKKKLMRAYGRIPIEMGFDVVKMERPVKIFDSAFGVIRSADSNIMSMTTVKKLEQKYPEFFKV